jgi:hypothetical protein
VEIRSRWSTAQFEVHDSQSDTDVAGIVASAARRFSVASPMQELGSIVRLRYQMMRTAGATMR